MEKNKLNNKYVILLFLLLFLTCFLISCAPSQHKYYKSLLKRRAQYGYKSHYQKKIKKRTIPINRNYILRYSRPKSERPGWR